MKRLELHLSLKARLKQFFCQHKNGVGWSCCTKGINRKDGYWHVTYECHSCKMTYGKWIKASKKEVDQMFSKQKHNLD